MSNPQQKDYWIAVKCIICYLKATLTHDLFLQSDPIKLEVYNDTDWTDCPIDNRSISGYCIYLEFNLISWCTKKQPTVVRSSTKAEYRILTHFAVEITWIFYLFNELWISLRTIPLIWCDNIFIISIIFNPIFHARTKHIDLDYHFICEKVDNKELNVRFISTIDQVADIFTKDLHPNYQHYLQVKLNI